MQTENNIVYQSLNNTFESLATILLSQVLLQIDEPLLNQNTRKTEAEALGLLAPFISFEFCVQAARQILSAAKNRNSDGGIYDFYSIYRLKKLAPHLPPQIFNLLGETWMKMALAHRVNEREAGEACLILSWLSPHLDFNIIVKLSHFMWLLFRLKYSLGDSSSAAEALWRLLPYIIPQHEERRSSIEILSNLISSGAVKNGDHHTVILFLMNNIINRRGSISTGLVSYCSSEDVNTEDRSSVIPHFPRDDINLMMEMLTTPKNLKYISSNQFNVEDMHSLVSQFPPIAIERMKQYLLRVLQAEDLLVSLPAWAPILTLLPNLNPDLNNTDCRPLLKALKSGDEPARRAAAKVLAAFAPRLSEHDSKELVAHLANKLLVNLDGQLDLAHREKEFDDFKALYVIATKLGKPAFSALCAQLLRKCEDESSRESRSAMVALRLIGPHLSEDSLNTLCAILVRKCDGEDWLAECATGTLLQVAPYMLKIHSELVCLTLLGSIRKHNFYPFHHKNIALAFRALAPQLSPGLMRKLHDQLRLDLKSGHQIVRLIATTIFRELVSHFPLELMAGFNQLLQLHHPRYSELHRLTIAQTFHAMSCRLETWLNDKNDAVSQTANYALETFIPILLKGLNDEKSTVRQAVAEALGKVIPSLQSLAILRNTILILIQKPIRHVEIITFLHIWANKVPQFRPMICTIILDIEANIRTPRSVRLYCLSTFHKIQMLMESERLSALAPTQLTIPDDVQKIIFYSSHR